MNRSPLLVLCITSLLICTTQAAKATDAFSPLNTQMSADIAGLEARTNSTAGEQRQLRQLRKAVRILTTNWADTKKFAALTRILTASRYETYTGLVWNAGAVLRQDLFFDYENLTNLAAHLPRISPFTNKPAPISRTAVALEALASADRLPALRSRLLQTGRKLRAELDGLSSFLAQRAGSNSIWAEWTDDSGHPWPGFFGSAVTLTVDGTNNMQWLLRSILENRALHKTYELGAYFLLPFIEGQSVYEVPSVTCDANVYTYFGPGLQTRSLGSADTGSFALFRNRNEYVVLFHCSGPHFTGTNGIARLEKRYIGAPFPGP